MFEPPLEVCARSYEAGRACLVSARLVGDLETPVSAYLKLAAGRAGRIFLLKSVEGGAARGRYSMIGLDPDVIFRVSATGRKSIAPRSTIASFFALTRRRSRLASAHRPIAVPQADGCRRWRRESSAISAMTWCARWSASAGQGRQDRRA